MKSESFHLAIQGPEKSPYKNVTFELIVSIPDRYPFVPPSVTFKTPVYHPNIDRKGTICLDLLKLPPAVNYLIDSEYKGKLESCDES